MATDYTNQMLQIIKNEYPNTVNSKLANELGITEATLRYKASQLVVRKSDYFMKKYYRKLQENRKI
ncbi:hypothetical protein EV204_11644 [Tissierella praeacuta]|uniref:hypothetical protein n=1 Tax=Tissierella praeacuta TaxID=43131 RepID=UPI001048649C|nr:hypothetical protein [Tissierella praeacuta]TCU65814.1 hypothetical protein EV204_11644 [Tissierella praeacuta]